MVTIHRVFYNDPADGKECIKYSTIVGFYSFTILCKDFNETVEHLIIEKLCRTFKEDIRIVEPSPDSNGKPVWETLAILTICKDERDAYDNIDPSKVHRFVKRSKNGSFKGWFVSVR